MPTGLRARRRVATEKTVFAGKMGVQDDDVAGLLLQPAVERDRIVASKRHAKAIAAQAQRQFLAEIGVVLKQTNT